MPERLKRRLPAILGLLAVGGCSARTPPHPSQKTTSARKSGGVYYVYVIAFHRPSVNCILASGPSDQFYYGNAKLWICPKGAK